MIGNKPFAMFFSASPRKDGHIARALKEIADTLKAEGVESGILSKEEVG